MKLAPELPVEVQEVVEGGVDAGWDLAHAHGNDPDADYLRTCIISQIKDALDEYFLFGLK